MSTRGSRRKRLFWGAGLGSVLVAGVVVAFAVLGTRTDEVASLNGNAVTRAEVLFHMGRLAPEVDNELGGADDGGKLLRQRALDEIRHDKALLILAREQGLIDSVDHDDFLASVDDENASRSAARAGGDVVYGVTEFAPEEYYGKRITDLTTALEKKLSATGGPVAATDAEVRAAFDADRGEWSANATTYAYSTLVVPASAAVGKPRALRDAAGVPGARLTTGTYDGGAATGLNGHDQELLAVLTTLQPGQVSAPQPGPGEVTYYQLDRRTVDEDAAFTTYAPRIRQSLVTEKFSQYLQRRAAAVDMDVDQAAVDAITPEDS